MDPYTLSLALFHSSSRHLLAARRQYVPSSDAIVTAKAVMRAQLELQRLGINKTVSLLESTEPDLAEFVIETSTELYQQVLNAGASSRQARRIHQSTMTLVLVALGALRQAHKTLWQSNSESDPAPPPGTSGVSE
jgi:hypothetical protein